MKEFFVQNWQFIVAVSISVLSSIGVWLIRKKPVLNQMDTILLCVLEKLPIWIQEVECLKGSDVKRTAVLNTASKYVLDVFHVNLSSECISLIGSWIEDILATPQKH